MKASLPTVATILANRCSSERTQGQPHGQQYAGVAGGPDRAQEPFPYDGPYDAPQVVHVVQAPLEQIETVDGNIGRQRHQEEEGDQGEDAAANLSFHAFQGGGRVAVLFHLSLNEPLEEASKT